MDSPVDSTTSTPKIESNGNDKTEEGSLHPNEQMSTDANQKNQELEKHNMDSSADSTTLMPKTKSNRNGEAEEGSNSDEQMNTDVNKEEPEEYHTSTGGDNETENRDNQQPVPGEKILQSTELNFEETDRGLKLNWTPIENFEKYLPRIERSIEETISDKETRKHELLLSTSVYGWKFGEEITVQLFALDQSGEKHAVTEKFEYIIGGKTVISKLCVEENVEKPCTCFDLAWNAPRDKPESYKVTVYRSEGKQFRKEEEKPLNDTKITIDNLTPSTSYYFEVIAIWADNSDGKPVRSQEIRTRADPNAQGVEILKCIPKRLLRVKWNNHGLDNIAYYTVYLQSGENSERIGEQKVEKSKTEVCFCNLKSDTDYVAHMITKGTMDEVIAESVSSPVSTEKIQRNLKYDITTEGKPVIKACGADKKDESLQSFLSWSVPNLGKERHNFVCVNIQAFITKSGEKAEKNQLEVQDNIRAKPKFLEFGKNYQFEIICTYKDLDSLILHEATATRTLQTEILPPSKPDAQFANKDIKVSWAPTKGAAKHTLKILDEAMNPVKTEFAYKGNSTKFPIDGSCGFGKKCTFVLTASGENGMEEESRKEVIIGGDNAVTDVVAKASRKRSIIVTWQPPKKSTNTYKIQLYEETPKKKILKQNISGQTKDQCTCTFGNLKAKKSYYCKVFAERNGNFKNGSRSDTVKTSEVKRNSEFNIRLKGKVEIRECRAILKNGKNESSFKWTLSDIGEETNNYHIAIRAFYTTQDKKQHQLELENPSEAKPIFLKFGENYKFSVQCTYRDLDDDTPHIVEDTRSLDTDIGNPVITKIDWKSRDILVDWKAAEGATSHFLSIHDDATKSTIHDKLKLDDQKYTLKMSQKCDYGLTCNFVLCAFGKNQKKKRDEKNILIGGDTICTGVIAQRDSHCPSRAVLLTWNSPGKRPDGYKVQILEKTTVETAVESVPLEATQSSYKFAELKADTKYVCRVFPIYSGKIGNGALSDHLQTSKRIETAMEKMQNFGKPEEISHRIVKKEKNHSAVEISWDPVEVGENFKLEKYHIDVYEPGRFSFLNTYHQQKDYGREITTTETIYLKTGKTIKVDLVIAYKDLDTHVRKKETSHYFFATQPNAPQIKDCVCNKEMVTFSWEEVDGIEDYIIEIKNLESNTIDATPESKSNCKAKYRISDKLCVGRRYKFDLTANFNGVKSEPISRTFLLGGKYAVTNVVLAKDEAVPRRAIVVNWNPPKKAPQEYQVELIQVDGNKTIQLKKEKTKKEIETLKFVELRTDNIYMCKVSPIYDEVIYDGTFSDRITTDTRITPEIETEDEYGKPEKISDNAASDNRKDSSVELSWSSTNVGENHKISKFHITVGECGAQSKIIYDEDVTSESRKVVVENVENGRKYDVTFTTVLIDLDYNESQEITKSHIFCMRASATNVEKCETTEDGLIVFTWNSVEGAEKYHLMVKDEFLSNKILYEKEIADAELLSKTVQLVKVEKSEEIRIGRTCMTKVVVYGNGLKSASDWKPHLIGGHHVPRNVKAKEYTANPQRCIQLTFDAPEFGPPDEYKVIPIPSSTIHKAGQLCKNSPVVVEYLRQYTKYSFQVSARHGDEWSEMSSSNILTTEKKAGQANVQEFRDAETINVHMPGAQMKGGTKVTLPKGKEFGQVRDLRPNITSNGHKDLLELDWKIPTFGNNASDYKVEKYKVDINKANSNLRSPFYLDFYKDKSEYSTESQELDLGETYEISISTIYIDIDKDVEYTSESVKVKVETRPCQPKVTENKRVDEKLRLSWNHAKGARFYVVSLFTDDSDEAVYSSDEGKATIYEKPFDEKFGFGKTYIARIEATGCDGKTNSSETERITIGEDHVPRQVKANIIHEKVVDPSTQVYLEWDPPKKVPVSYEVFFSTGEKYGSKIEDKTECIVSGLSAGTYYIFKVIAIHKDVNDKEKRSAGCLSNKIATSPKPTQVQNVRIEPGKNPCTSIVVEWDKVAVTKHNENVKYRVIAMKMDETIIKETTVTKTCEDIHELQPNTYYFITVAGGNSEGFGKNSAKLFFKTALGQPERVELVNSKVAPSTALILRFAEMEGKPQRYFAKLYRGQAIVSHSTEVQNGYIYEGLDANTKYNAKVYAVFESGDKGTPVKSGEIKTGPGTPEITEYGCCGDQGECSSRDLFLKWKSVARLSYYEVRIIFERNSETETEIIINNRSEMTYSCQHESCQYSVRIRTKNENEVFGDWSDKKLIDLGPSILRNIKAETDEKSDKITIRCDKSTEGTLQYCMQALCRVIDEKRVSYVNEGQVSYGSVQDDTVSFTYLPQKQAERYLFRLWAKSGNLCGKSANSNIVRAKPEKVKNVLITRAEENPNMIIKICWDAVDRCYTYEIVVERINSGTRECLAKVRNNLTYEHTCCHPEDKYNVRVRALRESTHGDWSDDTAIRLEPPILVNIKATLDVLGKNIKIECKRSVNETLSYFMQALCDEVNEGSVVKIDHNSVNGDIVHFSYTPQKFAEIYSFMLWTENSENSENSIIGKKARSNIVISKPAKVEKVSIKPDKDNPNAKVKISWNRLERCTFYEVSIRCDRPDDSDTFAACQEINMLLVFGVYVKILLVNGPTTLQPA